MTTNTINAASNPTLVNDLVKKATKETTQPVQPADITEPSNNMVTLPGGYITEDGEVITVAEVRELNGRDEEAIAKNPAVGKAIITILSRAVVKIGDLDVTEKMLDSLFAGDRDALLIGIYKATFGPTSKIEAYCAECMVQQLVEVDIDKDIKTKILIDPIQNRNFTVTNKGKEFLVTLPTGHLQKELLTSSNRTAAELTTLVLENTVREIDGRPVFSKNQVQNLGLSDRRVIGDEIAKRAFGPQLENITVSCPDCDGEVEVPINFGTLFRF